MSTSKTAKKKVFAFDRTNFILLAAGMAVVIVGMALMSGSGSNETTFNPEIFSARRVKVAPAICLFGYLFIIYGILRKPRDTESEKTADSIATSEKEA